MSEVSNELQTQSMANKIRRQPHPLPDNCQLERTEQAEEGTMFLSDHGRWSW